VLLPLHKYYIASVESLADNAGFMQHCLLQTMACKMHPTISYVLFEVKAL